jgi:hypothetical protein
MTANDYSTCRGCGVMLDAGKAYCGGGTCINMRAETDDYRTPPEDEPVEHWHVHEFTAGCLNDYDSGPYRALGDAVEHLERLVRDHNAHEEQEDMRDPDHLYVPAGDHRYEAGIRIIKVERCTDDYDECERAAQ